MGGLRETSARCGARNPIPRALHASGCNLERAPRQHQQRACDLPLARLGARQSAETDDAGKWRVRSPLSAAYPAERIRQNPALRFSLEPKPRLVLTFMS